MDIHVPMDWFSRLVYKVVAVSAVGAAYALVVNLGGFGGAV